MSGIYELDGVAPQIADDAWIAPGAMLMGDIQIGARVGVWFNAVLRGDNEKISVGDGSNIQELVMMHTDMGFPLTVGEDVTVGHAAILHGCTIGNNSLIGMGATVLNGAVIGDNCLIGANALVTEGKKIPDGSLVMGAPGKVVKTLDEQAFQMLKASALNYQQNADRFRKGMRPVR